MTSKGIKADSIIIGISILGIVFLSYLLYDDSMFFNDVSLTKAKILGKISTGSTDVRRKYMDNFAWLPVADFADVFLGDSIFTGKKAKANISLNNGANIIVESESLIILSMNEDSLVLDLQFGRMDAELTSEKTNLNLKIGNENVRLRGSAKPSILTLGKRKNDASSELRVKKGKINIQRGLSKIPVEVKESFKVLMDPAIAQLKVKSIIGFKEFASKQANVWVKPSEPVSMTWQHEGEAFIYEVEVAEDLEFKKILLKKNTNKEMLDWEPSKKIKKFFWRIRAYSQSEKQISVSDIRETSINRLRAPKIITPQPEQFFTVLRNANDDLMPLPQVPVLLEDDLASSTFKAELSLDDRFEKIERAEENVNKSFEFKEMPIGTYHLRVKSKQSGRPDSPWSTSRTFIVDEQESKRILAPKIVKQELEVVLKANEGKFSWPNEEWNSIDKAEKYIAEASGDSSFKTNVFLKTISNTNIEIPNLKEGKYYFRVRGANATTFGAWSEYGIINILQPRLQIEPIEDLIVTAKDWNATIPPQVLHLKWDLVAGAHSYFLEISNDKEFKKQFLNKTVNKNNYVITLMKDQTYYARVTPLDNKSKQITAASPLEEFDFIVKRPLKQPVLTQPKNKMSYILYKMDIPHIWVEWRSDEKATSHIVEFSKNAEFTKIKKTIEVTKTNLVLDRNLLKGKIFWRVKSINKKIELKSEWSEPQIFFVVGLENDDD